MRCIRLNTLMIFVTEHDADGRDSFASVEGSMSDRLLGAVSRFQAWRHQAVRVSTDHGLTGTSTFFYIWPAKSLPKYSVLQNLCVHIWQDQGSHFAEGFGYR
jgi:hypothetical protein